MRNIYHYITSPAKIGIVALVALLSLILTLIVASILAIPLFGIESFTAIVSSSMEMNESNIALLKYLQIAQSIGLFIIPSIILAYLFSSNSFSYLKLTNSPKVLSVVYVLFIVFSIAPIINLIGNWNAQMELPKWLSGVEEWMRSAEESAKIVTDLFLKTDNLAGLFVNILMIGVIPAIGEEFLFRGIIQKIVKQWTHNSHVAVWITAIIFSALHMQFYGFIPRILLGALFGYFFIWSGNLWLPIIAHFINNTTAVLAYYFYKSNVINVNPDEIGTEFNQWPLIVASGLIVGYFFYRLIKYEKYERLERIR